MATFVSFRNGGATDEQGWQEWLLKLSGPGTAINATANSWQVTQRGAGANMSVDVQAGDGVIAKTNFGFWTWSDSAANVVIATADPSNLRIDTVVAWVDLSVVQNVTNNNPGALKFSAVAGTPGGSPTAPSGATIQTAIGAGNPYLVLGNVAVAATVTSIVTANITDTRVALPLKGNLWGGSNNTKGHLVPNVADDTVALLNAVQTLIGKTLSLTGNTATGNILSNPNKFSVYRTAAFSLPGGSATTKIAFDTEEYDSGNNFDSTTNFRYTAPVAEFLRVSAGVGVLTGGAWTFNLLLYKNGVLYKNLGQGKTNSANTSLSGGVSLQLAATDYLEIFCFSNDTGANNLNVGQSSVWFCGELVSHT